ncbi:MAG: hypothetical protein COW03_15960 [Cytophagales bacterium CG12_big_fil_rev_8_21_14_0_65_40_12]|nr:MAG: hypothetical protein COW03_15960 [Cytophagales bacterium CG12_big_fil_rev_8_21_14_0_65_40_12]
MLCQLILPKAQMTARVRDRKGVRSRKHEDRRPKSVALEVCIGRPEADASSEGARPRSIQKFIKD